MTNRFELEKWSARIILLFTFLFMGWFVLSEWDGLRGFIDYLLNAIGVTPDAIQYIADYYGQLPSSQLIPSLGFGFIFGIGLTYLILLVIQDGFKLPDMRLTEIGSGILFGFVSYKLGLTFLNALLLTVGVALVVGFATQASTRNSTNIRIVTKIKPKMVLLSLLIGTIGGVLGSQLLTYPTRHCTYATETSPTEYQMGVIITLIGVIVTLLPIWTLINQRRNQINKSSAGHFKGILLPALFLLPTLLSLGVFLYYPASQIVTTSLGQSNPRLPGRVNFVCLDNYVRLAEDVAYRNNLSTTTIITLSVVFFAMVIALGIALVASQKVKGASIYRTFLIWPYALSPVVAGAIFLALFDQQSGIVNLILDDLFGVRVNWFTDTTSARVLIILASVWNILGFNILFYVAGLQNVPEDLIEAAQIDGANVFQRFFRITFPLLSPFTFFLLVTNVTYSFYGIYGAIDVLTQGGPILGAGGEGGATEVLIYALYSGNSQAGMAASQAIVLFFLVTAITVVQFRFVERRVTYAN